MNNILTLTNITQEELVKDYEIVIRWSRYEEILHYVKSNAIFEVNANERGNKYSVSCKYNNRVYINHKILDETINYDSLSIEEHFNELKKFIKENECDMMENIASIIWEKQDQKSLADVKIKKQRIPKRTRGSNDI